MSIDRELLEKVISGDNKGDFFVSYDLYKEIYEFLAKPEQEPVGIVRIIGGYPDNSERVVDWVRPYKYLKDGDRLYTAPPKPEKDNTQYLLDQVARLTAENAMLKEKWSTPKPEQDQEPVAWMFGNKLYKKLYGKNHLSLEERNSFIPLYTAPPVKSEQEPVAWIIETEIHGKLSEWVCTDKKHYMEEHDGTKEPIPLYLAPQKRELLGDGITADMYRANKKATHPDSYWAGVCDAEKAHGIGVGNE